MRKLLIIISSAILIIILANIFFYNSLYNKQIDYISDLLDRQAQIVGLSVDSIESSFATDLNQIVFSGNVPQFFSSSEERMQITERMKLFFSKYGSLVTGIKLYDNNKNEFTLKKDETSNSWLEQNFILHVQGEIEPREILIRGSRNFEYFLPVLENDVPVGNIVVTVDYQKYFNEVFSVFNFKDYQWQWVFGDSGQIIYNNSEDKLKDLQTDRITTRLQKGTVGNIIHRAEINGNPGDLIS